jgi:ABC-type lipoprotein release transport system permease subunit
VEGQLLHRVTHYSFFFTAHMAALGIGMVILGAIFGAVMFWSINRARLALNCIKSEERAHLPSAVEMQSGSGENNL